METVNSGRPGSFSRRRQPPVIAERLNLLLISAVAVLTLGLLWLGSHLPLGGTLLCGLLMAFVLLTNYALMHEAAHRVLHGQRWLNDLLGSFAGMLFPMSFTLLRFGHAVHHCCNRTDHEMFDYYYPHDRLWLKYGQWYGLISGLYYPLVPLGSILLAVAPALLRSGPFRRARTTAVLFDDFGAPQIRRVRIEVVATAVFWWAMFAWLDLQWQSVLLMYACFGFNWATRQYVTHAFSRRDVMSGAWNMRVSRPMGWILLNGQWDLVHHQQPWLPWTELAKAGQNSEPPVSYWRHYFRQWLGPRPNTEPAPQPLPRMPD
ncbi:fatty acid desaturase [Parachitinimonas caeni]|uniref:Fatty acid desaturase n=1 Tax=Parachitinimonas caeni TaxID=3031301 RepID=A0ABT7E0I3_9NEIS|nr:fatty acid desaturase [Parachitinimonas caeni]MDK2125820.1 fatty acid desaturase [Parachitinimonas caeni]